MWSCPSTSSTSGGMQSMEQRLEPLDIREIQETFQNLRFAITIVGRFLQLRIKQLLKMNEDKLFKMVQKRF